jgi:hypothetical protein
MNAIPKKLGLRGNPVLMCRECAKNFSYPRITSGKPLPQPKDFLTHEEVDRFFSERHRLRRVSGREVADALGIDHKKRKELNALCRLSPDRYREVASVIQSGASVQCVLNNAPELNYELAASLTQGVRGRCGINS